MKLTISIQGHTFGSKTANDVHNFIKKILAVDNIEIVDTSPINMRGVITLTSLASGELFRSTVKNCIPLKPADKRYTVEKPHLLSSRLTLKQMKRVEWVLTTGLESIGMQVAYQTIAGAFPTLLSTDELKSFISKLQRSYPIAMKGV